MTETRKAKRKLSNIDFNKEGAHLALVDKSIGGPANGHDYALVMKGSNLSDEFITKVQQVKVTMELPDFLQRFFYIYGEDAKVLATLLGYKEPVDSAKMEADEAQQEMDAWFAERVSAFEIIKSLHEAESLPEALSKLTEDEFFAVRKDQQKLEKAISKLEKAKSKALDKSLEKEESETSTDDNQEIEIKAEKSVEPSGSKPKDKENDMTDKVEVVEKSVLELVQKQLDENIIELQKAKDLVAQYEKDKKETLQKARFEKVKLAVKDEDKAAVLFKAVGLVEDETEFEAVVKTLADMQAVVEKSALFSEQGATLEEETAPTISPVAKIIKSRLEAQKK